MWRIVHVEPVFELCHTLGAIPGVHVCEPDVARHVSRTVGAITGAHLCEANVARFVGASKWSGVSAQWHAHRAFDIVS